MDSLLFNCLFQSQCQSLYLFLSHYHSSQICWLRYGYLTVDMLMITTNVILLATSIAYLFIFIYYLPDKVILINVASVD